MELNVAKDMAITYMEKYGLIDKGWYFEFDNAKRRFGCCFYGSKKITLSSHLVKLNDVKHVKDTILHEIAHALCPGENHNEVWRKKAIEIGCDGKTCYDSKTINTPKPSYKSTCTNCDRSYGRFKRPTHQQSCGKCSGSTFNSKYILNWVKI